MRKNKKEPTLRPTAQSISVSDINLYLKNVIEGDEFTRDIWIHGDITNLAVYQKGGQLYFNLSDGVSRINCVMYLSFLENLGFVPENGLHVHARGKLQYFHRRGDLKFQVAYMTTRGVGALAKEFEQLKQRLYQEGLFDDKYKQPIPRYPQKIVLITAFNSAAMWDFVTIVRQWAPHIRLTVVPAVVQGIQCAPSVISALGIAETVPDADLIVILRGGGSAEDLAGFNNEALIRRIFACKVPVISAIGHEVDVTLADFVADKRAKTPTEAAQLCVHHFIDLDAVINEKLRTLKLAITNKLSDTADEVKTRLKNASVAVRHRLEKNTIRITHLLQSAEAANPLHKLRQGYSICRNITTNEIVRSVHQAIKGNKLITKVTDGEFESLII